MKTTTKKKKKPYRIGFADIGEGLLVLALNKFKSIEHGFSQGRLTFKEEGNVIETIYALPVCEQRELWRDIKSKNLTDNMRAIKFLTKETINALIEYGKFRRGQRPVYK